MKRLFLLFIPLVFFFGCEKDNPDAISQSNNSVDCDCGIVVDQEFYPAYAGYFIFDNDGNDGNGSVIGDHADYTISYIENNCTGNIGLTDEETILGQSFCLSEEYIWSDLSINSQMSKNCNNDSISTNNKCGIILDVAIFYSDNLVSGVGGVELVLENCVTNKIGKTCVTIWDEEDFSSYNSGELFCPDWNTQSIWSDTNYYFDITMNDFVNFAGCSYGYYSFIHNGVFNSQPYLSFTWPDN